MTINFATTFMDLCSDQEREIRRLRWLIDQLKKARDRGQPVDAFADQVDLTRLEVEALERRIETFLDVSESA